MCSSITWKSPENLKVKRYCRIIYPLIPTEDRESFTYLYYGLPRKKLTDKRGSIKWTFLPEKNWDTFKKTRRSYWSTATDYLGSCCCDQEHGIVTCYVEDLEHVKKYQGCQPLEKSIS